MITRRFIVAAKAAPYAADPTVTFVPVTALLTTPRRKNLNTKEFLDCLDDGLAPVPEGVYYLAVLENGKITVERDLFSPGEFPHTYSGWPIPGELKATPR